MNWYILTNFFYQKIFIPYILCNVRIHFIHTDSVEADNLSEFGVAISVSRNAFFKVDNFSIFLAFVFKQITCSFIQRTTTLSTMEKELKLFEKMRRNLKTVGSLWNYYRNNSVNTFTVISSKPVLHQLHNMNYKLTCCRWHWSNNNFTKVLKVM